MLSRSLFPSSRNRIDDQRSRARQTRPHADCHDDALASTLPSTHSACRPRDGAHFSSHRGSLSVLLHEPHATAHLSRLDVLGIRRRRAGAYPLAASVGSRSLASGSYYASTLRPTERHTLPRQSQDRKSTRLNSSHGYISYAVF